MPAFLAKVEGFSGPQVQILYGEPGRFPGHPDGWKPAAMIELPDRKSWSIAEAEQWVLDQTERKAPYVSM